MAEGLYLEVATEEDKKLAENWKADAEGILICVSQSLKLVFHTDSLAIDRFILSCCCILALSLDSGYSTGPSEHVQLLPRQHISDSCRPQSIQYLKFLPASPPPFSPPNYAVWVNALWFLSLVIGLTCALLATLLQQWARRYLMFSQSCSGLHKRARIRAFLTEGVEKLLSWTVETLPSLLHISLLVFFSGLVVFLWNVDLTIFKLVLSWVGICTALYGCITVMPIFRHDSPYITPTFIARVAHCYGNTMSHILGSQEACTSIPEVFWRYYLC